MKKGIATIAGALIGVALLASSVSAADLKMSVKGKPVAFQYGTPFIEDGSSLMPLRDLLVALGVPNDDDHIQWEGDTKTVTVRHQGMTIKLAVGDKAIYKNGALFKELEVPAKQVIEQDSRVFLPARAVAEALGNKVGYDEATSTVTIEAAEPVNKPAVLASTDGDSILLPAKTAADGQLYGMILETSFETGKLTLVLADGSKKELLVADDANIVGIDGDKSTGQAYKTYFHSGIAATVKLSSDGKTIVAAELEPIQVEAKVLSVKQEKITINESNGKTTERLYTELSADVGGRTITFNTVYDVKLDNVSAIGDLKQGDAIVVAGTVVGDAGYLIGIAKK